MSQGAIRRWFWSILNVTERERCRSQESVDPTNEDRSFDPAIAMVRIVWFALAGCLTVAAFVSPHFERLAAGLITAGGSMVVGGLLGFIFGVPFSKEPTESDNSDQGSKLETRIRVLDTDPTPAWSKSPNGFRRC